MNRRDFLRSSASSLVVPFLSFPNSTKKVEFIYNNHGKQEVCLSNFKIKRVKKSIDRRLSTMTDPYIEKGVWWESVYGDLYQISCDRFDVKNELFLADKWIFDNKVFVITCVRGCHFNRKNNNCLITPGHFFGRLYHRI